MSGVTCDDAHSMQLPTMQHAGKEAAARPFRGEQQHRETLDRHWTLSAPLPPRRSARLDLLLLLLLSPLCLRSAQSQSPTRQTELDDRASTRPEIISPSRQVTNRHSEASLSLSLKPLKLRAQATASAEAL
jgi:hypothetical protein